MEELESTEGTKKLGLVNFEAVSKFKSLGRAIRRGLVSPIGFVYPRRPFNNRAGKRPINELKKNIYGQLKRIQSEKV